MSISAISKHAVEGRNHGNSRNGTRTKTVLTEIGPVDIEVPRDRDSSFDPRTVRKHQRRLDGVDSMVISLTAKGLTTGEVEAHLAEVYSTTISRETISKITDRVLGELAEWQTRPLDRVYPVVFIDAIVVKIRDGQVANRPVYTAIGVSVDGQRDILGLWVGTGGEGAKYWLQVLTEIKNRGVEDVCIVVCDGLKGLPESIEATWPLADRADLRVAPDPQHLPARLPAGLGPHGPRPTTRLHRRQRSRRRALPRRVRHDLGQPLPGHRSVVDQRLVRVRAVPRLRPRDPPGDLHRRMRLSTRRGGSSRLPVGDGHFVGPFGVFDESAFLIA